MKRTIGICTLVLAAGVAACASAATTCPAPALSFGRSGGNIIPFTVSISATGHVTAVGVKVGKTAVPAATVKTLQRLAASARFSAMPSLTLCPQTLPDFAAPWIRIGGHRVAVRGTCRPAFTRLYETLRHAVALSS